MSFKPLVPFLTFQRGEARNPKPYFKPQTILNPKPYLLSSMSRMWGVPGQILELGLPKDGNRV